MSFVSNVKEFQYIEKVENLIKMPYLGITGKRNELKNKNSILQ